MLLDVQTVELDMLANTFMRAPGEAVGTFALECAMDELAEKLGIDPIELRLLNEPEKDPTSGLPFSARHIDEAWRTGAEKFGWDQRKAAPRSRQDGEWLVGMGCATATYPYYRMPGGAARITLAADGKATIDIAAHEMGMGTATAQTQIAAERLGLPLDAITLQLWRFDLARRGACRRIAADRRDRRFGDRGASRAGQGIAEACRQ